MSFGCRSCSHHHYYLWLWLVLLSSFLLQFVDCIIPDTIIRNDATGDEWLARRGDFGSSSKEISGRLIQSPLDDEYLCNFVVSNYTDAETGIEFGDNNENNNLILMVPRGQCTFGQKAHIAETYYNAVGIVVYDTLAGRYRYNETSERVIFPSRILDYECSNGYGTVYNLQLDPEPYDGLIHDPILDLTSPVNNCTLQQDRCESEICVVTGHKINSTSYPVCCAWDTGVAMQPDDRFDPKVVAIFVRIRQSASLLADAVGQDITIQARPITRFNISIIFIWIWGVLVTAAGSWYSANDYRLFDAKLTRLKDKKDRKTMELEQEILQSDDDDDDDDAEDGGDNNRNNPPQKRTNALFKNNTNKSQNRPTAKRAAGEEENSDDDDDDDDESSDDNQSENSDEDNNESDSDSDSQQQKQQAKQPPGQRKPPATRRKPSQASQKLRKKRPTTLHSIPPSGRNNKKNNKNDKEPMVLYSLPPDRKERRQRHRRRPIRADHDSEDDEDSDNGTNNDNNDDDSDNERDASPYPRTNRRAAAAASGRNNNGNNNNDNNDDDENPTRKSQDSSYELTTWHVLGFLVSASALLLLLFYFQFYSVIVVLYAFACAGGVSHLIFGPALVHFVPKISEEISDELDQKVFCGLTGYDIISQGSGYIWAGLWAWVALSTYDPAQNFFFWFSQNIFGTCFCIVVLGIVKLNSIQIATYLMLSIFFYDIFFVFITPFIFGGESVMITVVKGGADGNSAGEAFCYKYPDHKSCRGINVLPMLLSLPRIGEYRPGSVLLGLGDIVLPGFLIAFAARLEACKKLIGIHHPKIDMEYPKNWKEGYFVPLMIAYAFGLFLANMAVVITGLGQPALLYLVPCCLGTMCIIARKEIKDLWMSAKPIQLSDRLIAKYERAWKRKRMREFVERRKQEREAEIAQKMERGESIGDNLDALGRPLNRNDHLIHNNNGTPNKQTKSSRNDSTNDNHNIQNTTNNNRRKDQPRGKGGRSGRGDRGGRGGRGGGGGGRSSNNGRGPTNSTRPSSSPTRSNNNNNNDDNNEMDHNVNNDNNDDDSNRNLQDIYFGDNNHRGTRQFIVAIRKAAKTFSDQDFGPPIYKEIKKDFRSSKFYKRVGKEWQEVSKNELIDRVRKTFTKEQARHLESTTTTTTTPPDP